MKAIAKACTISVLSVLFLSGLVSCRPQAQAPQPSKPHLSLTDVSVGMTQEAVKVKLGNPASAKTWPSGEVMWEYYQDFAYVAKGDTLGGLTLLFTDGKLTAISPVLVSAY